MLQFSANKKVDPIGIEPTTSTLPVEGTKIVSGGKNHDKTHGPTLVRPNVRPSEQENDTLTAELLAIWSELDDEYRRAILDDFRARFGGDRG